MNGRIFISYRREDSQGSTGRLYDHLRNRFPQSEIFMDIDAIAPGEDFVESIEAAVGTCSVLVAVIGKNWLQISDRQGRPKLSNDSDFVRTEIRAALQRNISIIPVLVENALMPSPDDLPDDLKLFTRRNAIELSFSRFDIDSDRLITRIQQILNKLDTQAKAEEEKKRETQEQLRKQQTDENQIKQKEAKAKQDEVIKQSIPYKQPLAPKPVFPKRATTIEELAKWSVERSKQKTTLNEKQRGGTIPATGGDFTWTDYLIFSVIVLILAGIISAGICLFVGFDSYWKFFTYCFIGLFVLMNLYFFDVI